MCDIGRTNPLRPRANIIDMKIRSVHPFLSFKFIFSLQSVAGVVLCYINILKYNYTRFVCVGKVCMARAGLSPGTHPSITSNRRQMLTQKAVVWRIAIRHTNAVDVRIDEFSIVVRL